MPSVGQLAPEVVSHDLDAAIACWRNGKPRADDDRDSPGAHKRVTPRWIGMASSSVGRDAQPRRNAPDDFEPVRLRLHHMLAVCPPFHPQLHPVTPELKIPQLEPRTPRRPR